MSYPIQLERLNIFLFVCNFALRFEVKFRVEFRLYVFLLFPIQFVCVFGHCVVLSCVSRNSLIANSNGFLSKPVASWWYNRIIADIEKRLNPFELISYGSWLRNSRRASERANGQRGLLKWLVSCKWPTSPNERTGFPLTSNGLFVIRAQQIHLHLEILFSCLQPTQKYMRFNDNNNNNNNFLFFISPEQADRGNLS